MERYNWPNCHVDRQMCQPLTCSISRRLLPFVRELLSLLKPYEALRRLLSMYDMLLYVLSSKKLAGNFGPVLQWSSAAASGPALD